MQRYLYGFIVIITLALLFGAYKIQTASKVNSQGFSSQAADATNSQYAELAKGKVMAVESKTETQNSHYSRITESLNVQILNGAEKDQTVDAVYDDTLSNPKLQEVNVGDIIIVGKIIEGDQTSYVLVDRYRLNYLYIIGGVFLLLALIFGRLRGLTSVVGLAAGIGILILFIVPNILQGKDPVLVTLVGAGLIAIVSMFLAHGFNRRTSIAVISTLLTLGLAELLANIFVNAAKLLGNGSEAAFYIQAGYFGAINLQGLLLGGIIIGTLGVLNDITTTQAATVEELHSANNQLSFKQLYIKAGSVGREHIASLINTLVLTYVGASLPLFILFYVSGQQLWLTLNSATIAEEIIRTLVGSIALILAVPITTALAAYLIHFSATKTSPIKG